jgi:hypothetical protein
VALHAAHISGGNSNMAGVGVSLMQDDNQALARLVDGHPCPNNVTDGSILLAAAAVADPLKYSTLRLQSAF